MGENLSHRKASTSVCVAARPISVSPTYTLVDEEPDETITALQPLREFADEVEGHDLVSLPAIPPQTAELVRNVENFDPAVRHPTCCSQEIDDVAGTAGHLGVGDEHRGKGIDHKSDAKDKHRP